MFILKIPFESFRMQANVFVVSFLAYACIKILTLAYALTLCQHSKMYSRRNGTYLHSLNRRA